MIWTGKTAQKSSFEVERKRKVSLARGAQRKQQQHNGHDFALWVEKKKLWKKKAKNHHIFKMRKHIQLFHPNTQTLCEFFRYKAERKKKKRNEKFSLFLAFEFKSKS